MTTLRSGEGEVVHLGAEIGRGGEGTVYSIQGKPGFAAKIYKPELAPERQVKIVAMTAARWQTSHFVAFPVDTLFNASGMFCGFSMPKVGSHRAVHELYSPTGRKSAFPQATYPFLVRCVVNIARAMAGVHATGCVIGDINHSGILVSKTATVTLIDSDSFQVRRDGHFFPCKVGVQEFTPPELQGKPLDRVLRTENHDAFGLAVLLFYTLFMGRHPYAGRYLGTGDMPMDRAIAEFRFAYSARRTATQMEPPPNVPSLTDLPLKMADAFELSFGPAGSTSGRPTAKEWIALLTEAEVELVRCTANIGHHHFRQAGSCPWCRMEKAYPGFQAFAPVVPAIAVSAPINLAQLISMVRNVPDPGPPPTLNSLISTPLNLSPSSAIKALQSFRVKRLSTAMLCGAAGVAASAFQGIGPVVPLVGLGAFAITMFSAFSGKGSRATFDNRVTEADRLWKDKEASFSAAAGNQTFSRIRGDANSLIVQIQKLAEEEQRRISDLASKVQQAQLIRFLEGHSIENAKIKGLGTARKLILRSYGIETAADVERGRIERIHGFGPAKARTLIAWRRSMEAKFKFDPRRGVDPRDIAAVKADIAKRQFDGGTRLKNTISALHKASADALTIRGDPHIAEQEAYTNLEQARVDQRAIAFDRGSKTQLTFIAVLSFFIGLSPHFATPKVPKMPSPRAAEVEVRPGDLAKPMPNIVERPIEAPGNEKSGTRAPTEPPTLNLPPPEQTTDGSQQLDSEAPPLPPPREIKTVPNGPPPVVSPPLLNLADKVDAARVQRQLKALGFLTGEADGIWGRQSRAALQAFRVANRLGRDDLWDTETQERLLDFAW
ncbi:peptidoglycan-binding protein [Mesorhizobium sp. W016]